MLSICQKTKILYFFNQLQGEPDEENIKDQIVMTSSGTAFPETEKI